MAEVKLRYNVDAEEVELVVDNEVALSSGNDVFKSWVEAYNDKHKPVEAPVEQKVVDVSPAEVVETPAEQVVETGTEPELDNQ